MDLTADAGVQVHVYYGRNRAWTAQEMARYGVVLTTYATMALEAPKRAGIKHGEACMPYQVRAGHALHLQHSSLDNR